MTSRKDQALINIAIAGKISTMYALIASGGNPFAIDETGQNALDYAIKSDPIKSCILLIDLDKTCNCPTKKQIINNYL